jgi:hypothetical protein
VREIPLSGGRVAKVSDEDYDVLSQWKWSCSRGSRGGQKEYAIRAEGKKFIRMHRFIMGLGCGKEDQRVVHHRDNDGLNNQRENLEVLESNQHNMLESPGWARRTELYGDLPDF